MQRLAIVVAAALAAAGVSATGAIAAAPDAAESKKEKKICRTSKATGSLTRRTRICRTEAEWRELNDRSRQGVQDLQNSASGSRVTPICDAAGQGPGCAPPGF